MKVATQTGTTRSLADGNSIPLLGLGVWRETPHEDFAHLDELDRTEGTDRAVERKWW